MQTTTDDLDLPVLLRADGNLQLLEDLPHPTRRGRLVISRGFRSDLASVPFFLRGLIPNAGRRVNRAAFAHDWCCEHLKWRLKNGLTLDDAAPDGPMWGPRGTDVMFRETLRCWGTPPLMAWLYWTGVRWGALGSAYRRPGWLRDFPLLLLVTVLTSWLTVPAGLTALLFLCLYMIAEAVVHSTVTLAAAARGTWGDALQPRLDPQRVLPDGLRRDHQPQ